MTFLHGRCLRDLCTLGLLVLVGSGLGCSRATPTNDLICDPSPNLAEESPQLSERVDGILGLEESPPPTLWFVMIDRSTSYYSRTPMAMQIATEVISAVVRPGDLVVGSWVGISSGDVSQTFFPPPGSGAAIGRVPEAQRVNATPPPEWNSEYDCRPHNESESSRNLRLVRRDEALSNWLATTEAWAESAEEQREIARRATDSAVVGFGESFAESLVDMPDAEGGTHILEALYDAQLATESLRRTIDRGRYRLLLFSDMEEWRVELRSEVQPDLTDTEVLIALVPVDTADTFEALVGYWTETLQRAGARRVEILSERVSDSTAIVGELERWNVEDD